MKQEIQIKRLAAQDVLIFQKLIRLFQDVFEMENPSEVEKPYLIKLLKKPEFIVYCAIFENEVMGGVTAYELPIYYSEDSEIFIYDIAVKTEFQRKGVGKKLLLSLKEYGKQNNMNVIFVAANEEDKHALDFYHSEGGKAEKVVHFNFALDE